MAVQEGNTVQVHYRGTLEDGLEFDSSAGRDPIQFTVGAGEVIPGFEKAVVGLEAGDKATITITPDEAYGERLAEAVQPVPLTAFSEEPPVGAMVELMSPDGQRMAATVMEIGDDLVMLDFNHPLAGKTLTFELELVDVLPAD